MRIYEQTRKPYEFPADFILIQYKVRSLVIGITDKHMFILQYEIRPSNVFISLATIMMND